MFYDQVKIHVVAGRGGNGKVAFRREKYIAYGGPSGGDGGEGGDIILSVNPHDNTLYKFAHKKDFKAQDGHHGGTKDKHGAAGEDLIIPVPPGTLVFDDKTEQMIADLTEPGEQTVVAEGGRGGRGNARFATSTNQAPRIAEQGDPGEERWLRLELKLLADVGLVGKPNAGKSTLLSVTTAAEPEVADYPFTTLQPNLGVVALSPRDTFVMADLPGLIQGASQGKGLGLEFLRHIERTRVLIHLIDGSALDPIEDFETINEELASFGHGLMDKPQIIAINKLDVPGVREMLPEYRAAFEALGYEEFIGVSALTRENVRELLGRAYQMVQEAPEPQVYQPRPMIVRHDPLQDEGLVVRRIAPDTWRVWGGKVVRAVNRAQTDYHESFMRLHGYLERQGVLNALRAAGVQEGDTVRIGEFEFEWQED